MKTSEWIVGGALTGIVIGGLAWLLGSARRINPHEYKWSDFIRGEYWLDDSGESIFADQDLGDVGHEALATNAMIDPDALIDGLLAHEMIDARKADELRETAEEYGVTSALAEADIRMDDIPKEVGRAATGSAEIWKDVTYDVRMAYAKHRGGILVIDRNFSAWKVTADVIRAIQEFVLTQAEEAAGGKIDDPKTEVAVEEISTGKYANMTVSEFLTIKHPRELWAAGG